MKTMQYKSISTIFLLLFALLIPAGSALAQSAETEPVIIAEALEDQVVGSAEISFEMLEKEPLTLRNSAVQKVRFELPPRWQIDQVAGENLLTVYYDVAVSMGTALEDDAATLAGAPRMNILFDGIAIGAVPLTAGFNQKAVLPLPSEAFSDLDVTQHDIEFNTSLGYSCSVISDNSELPTVDLAQTPDVIVTVHDTTYMQVDYTLLPPTTTLADFPQPFGDASLLPIVVPLVVADDFDEATLEVAASLAATLGSLNSRVASVELITVSQVKAGLLQGRDAIIIGTPTDNSIVANFEAYSLDMDDAGSSTGVLHAVLSPDGDNAYLLVTGKTMRAVSHAAQALSAESNNTMLGFTSDLAFIDSIVTENLNPFAEADSASLSALGYDGRLYTGEGELTSGVAFFVPADWEITEDARLSVNYGASSALQNASGLTVRLNRTPIGSVRAETASNGHHNLVIDIPKEDIRVGEINRLVFDVANRIEQCNVPEDDMIWSRIFDDGALYLPHQKAGFIRHDDPISPLLTRQDMTDIAFAVPAEPTADEVNHLLQTAWIIGRKSAGFNFQPTVILGEVRESVVADKNLVVIGQPSRATGIELVNDVLPQPFALATDTIRQEVGTVKFDLPSDHEIGIIESIEAPWNAEKSVTVVSGTSAQGVAWATNALIDNQLNWQLNGNLAFIRDETISALDLEIDMLTERQALANVNAAVVKAVQVEEPTILEEVVADVSAETNTEAAATTAVVEDTELNLQSSPEDYVVAPTQMPRAVVATAAGLIVVGLATALLGMLVSRRQNNVPAL